MRLTDALHRRALRAAAFLLVVIVPFATLAATSAAASADDAGVLLSTDGVHWTGRLSANVFDTSKPLVPGDTLSGSFYVKNGRDAPAWLRVGLSTVTVTDWSLAQAINITTVGTTSSDSSGTSASLAGTGAVCSDLLRRDSPIPAGGVVLVSMDLRFRSTVSGTDGQGHLAKIGFVVELSDLDLNTTDTPLCSGSVQVGAVDPAEVGAPGGSGVSTPGGGTDGDPTRPASGGSAGGDGTAASGTDSASGGARDSSGTIGADSATGTADGAIAYGGGARLVLPDTVREYEEYAILVLLGAALAGMILRLVAQRRWERANGPTAEGNDE